MDFGFVIVALAIVLPFVLFGLAISSKQKRLQQETLNTLMARVGLKGKEVTGVKEQLLTQKNKGWYVWLTGLFKKAGITNKNTIIRLFVIQAFLIFVSAFVFATRFNTLSENDFLIITILPFFPVIYLAFKIKQRQKELRKQFPEMLDSVVRSLHSGYSIDGALGAVGQDMRGPLAAEMSLVNKQLTLGISMRDILREFQNRVALPEAQFFVITLIIQRETGGQLAAILSELSKLMRRREMFQGKLKTLTAESRFTAWFIGGAPVAYIGYKYFFDRESMNFFLNDPTGIQLFSFSVVMIVIGTLILRQMLKMRF